MGAQVLHAPKSLQAPLLQARQDLQAAGLATGCSMSPSGPHSTTHRVEDCLQAPLVQAQQCRSEQAQAEAERFLAQVLQQEAQAEPAPKKTLQAPLLQVLKAPPPLLPKDLLQVPKDLQAPQLQVWSGPRSGAQGLAPLAPLLQVLKAAPLLQVPGAQVEL